MAGRQNIRGSEHTRRGSKGCESPESLATKRGSSSSNQGPLSEGIARTFKGARVLVVFLNSREMKENSFAYEGLKERVKSLALAPADLDLVKSIKASKPNVVVLDNCLPAGVNPFDRDCCEIEAVASRHAPKAKIIRIDGNYERDAHSTLFISNEIAHMKTRGGIEPALDMLLSIRKGE